MSGIVLSASVRQNLLSLQSTADLLATTQNRLSTGKKVNSALDNPTNFFTAQGLDNRASDINNLLDSIGNGVQVLQAANTGITSLQKLVDTAKSIANQALQTTVGYSTKSNVSATIPGATPADLRGTTTFTSARRSVTSFPTAPPAALPRTGTRRSAALPLRWSVLRQPRVTATPRTLASTLLLTGANAGDRPYRGRRAHDGDILAVNGKTITFKAGPPPAAAAVPSGSGVSGNIVTDGNGNSNVYLGAARLRDVSDLKAIDLASGLAKDVNTAGAAVITGSTSSINAGTGVLTLNTSTGADLDITGKADLLKALGLTTSVGPGNVNVGSREPPVQRPPRNLIQDGSTLTVEWPYHHLLQRARASGGAGPDRFGHPQRRPDRRQR